MKPATVLGVLLILVGLIALIARGVSWTEREKVLDVGPIEATATTKRSVAIPVVAGIAALAGGLVLVIAGSRR